MKICHVCNYHSVEDGRVFQRACVSLAKAGYEVHLFALGKGIQSYRQKGVFIHPIPQSVSRFDRFLRRSRIAKMAAKLNPDLFHVHEPELLGSVLACAKSKPVVYDVHESFLDVLKERDWIPRFLKPGVCFAWEKWERHLIKRCGGIVVVTEQIAQRYYELHNKVKVISNFPELSEIPHVQKIIRDGRRCVFAGSLSPDRGLSEVIAALAILKLRGFDVPLELAGPPISSNYLESLWNEADRLGVRKLITYHGILSKADTWNLLQQAGIGLVPYLPVANSMLGLASKLLECMAVGIPVVFSNFPNYREVAEKSGAGIPVDPRNPEEIANAIELLVRKPDLAKQMGEAGERAISEKFNWGVHCEKLLRLYGEILGEQKTQLSHEHI